MCSLRQRRAFFPDLNLQKLPEHVAFCIFSPGNVLRATTACTFSTSRLPKDVRTWYVLYILTSKFQYMTSQKRSEPVLFCLFFCSKCASRQSSLHFFDLWTAKSSQMQCFKCFTWKYISRDSGVHFFHISTSKRRPNLICLYILTSKISISEPPKLSRTSSVLCIFSSIY